MYRTILSGDDAGKLSNLTMGKRRGPNSNFEIEPARVALIQKSP